MVIFWEKSIVMGINAAYLSKIRKWEMNHPLLLAKILLEFKFLETTHEHPYRKNFIINNGKLDCKIQNMKSYILLKSSTLY